MNATGISLESSPYKMTKQLNRGIFHFLGYTFDVGSCLVLMLQCGNEKKKLPPP